MFTEDDLLPISALQHLIYCPRQCALIHVEQQWAENKLTIEGRHLHEKAHDVKKSETRPGLRIARGLPLRSFTLGLIGQADVVEFHEQGDQGRQVIPIEYKRGKPKEHDADSVQLCAQALCLEEMLGCSIATGRLFYGKIRRRQDVNFTSALRQRTQQVAADLHAMFHAGQTPKAEYEKHKCDRCSLIDLCMSDTLRSRRTMRTSFITSLNQSLEEI
jgi:CRISPR-associated exonuclease Cas4